MATMNVDWVQVDKSLDSMLDMSETILWQMKALDNKLGRLNRCMADLTANRSKVDGPPNLGDEGHQPPLSPLTPTITSPTLVETKMGEPIRNRLQQMNRDGSWVESHNRMIEIPIIDEANKISPKSSEPDSAILQLEPRVGVSHIPNRKPSAATRRKLHRILSRGPIDNRSWDPGELVLEASPIFKPKRPNIKLGAVRETNRDPATHVPDRELGPFTKRELHRDLPCATTGPQSWDPGDPILELPPSKAPLKASPSIPGTRMPAYMEALTLALVPSLGLASTLRSVIPNSNGLADLHPSSCERSKMNQGLDSRLDLCDADSRRSAPDGALRRRPGSLGDHEWQSHDARIERLPFIGHGFKHGSGASIARKGTRSIPGDVRSGGGGCVTEAGGRAGLVAKIIGAVKPSAATPFKATRRSSKAVTVPFGIGYVSSNQNLGPEYGNGVSGLGYWGLAYSFGPLTRDFGFGYCRHESEVDHRNRTGCIRRGHSDFGVTVDKQEQLGLQKGSLDDYDHKVLADSFLDGNSSHRVKSFVTLSKGKGRCNRVLLDFLGHTVVKVACGNEHVVALVSAGKVYKGDALACYSWDSNKFGQLGMGDRESRHRPEIVGTFNQDSPWEASEVACGSLHTALLARKKKRPSDTLDITCWTFGLGDNGQFGLATTQNGVSPQQVKELPDSVSLISVNGGLFHTSIVSSAKDVWSGVMEKGLGLCPAARVSAVSGAAITHLLISCSEDSTQFQNLVQVACGAAHTVIIASVMYLLTQLLEIGVTMKFDEKPHSSELTSLLKGLVGSNIAGRLLNVDDTQQIISRLGQKWGRLHIKEDAGQTGEKVHRGILALQWSWLPMLGRQ